MQEEKKKKEGYLDIADEDRVVRSLTKKSQKSVS
jgi:hypothetical protein